MTGGIVLVGMVTGLPLLALGAELVAGGLGGLDLLAEPALWVLLGRTLTNATVVTFVSVLVGAPLGWVFARTDVPLRRALWLLHTLPLFMPPFLLALGWFDLLELAGLSGSVLFGDKGVVFVLSICLAPVVTALTAGALMGVDPSLEEAGHIVARPARVALGITLPAARPAVVLGGVMVFSLAASELGVPLFLGSRAYTESVFSRLGGIDYAPGEAVALAVPLLAVGLLLVACERRFVGDRRFALIGLRRQRPAVALGGWRPLVTVAGVVAGAAALTPLLGLIAQAMSGNTLPPVGHWVGGSLETSLTTGALAAAIALVLAILVGRALVEGRPVARALDVLLFLGFLTPAAVLGVGLIAVWNRPATAWIYAGPAILVFGGVARYAILALRVAAVDFAQSSPRLEEAARIAGAGFVRRLLFLVLPVHWRGLVLAFLLTLLFCLRDLDTFVLFYPAGHDPLMVRIFTLEANGPPEVVAGLALLQILVLGAVLAIGGWVLSRRPAR
jgi:iron(III) transport system permease protein